MRARASAFVYELPRTEVNASLGSLRGLWLFLILGLYAVGLVWMRGLQLAPHKDEKHYWETTLYFFERLPPGLGDLSGYAELTTPLAFLLWAAVEAVSGLELVGGRLTTLLFAIGTLAWVGFPRQCRDTSVSPQDAFLATVGLLLFPYFLPLSFMLYTDIIAAFFVTAGIGLYQRRRHVAAMLLFALGIATRQYMLVFPLAVFCHELTRMPGVLLLWNRNAFWYAAAAATIGFWFVVFGSWVPSGSLAAWSTPMVETAAVHAGHPLYVTTLIGAYFVVPELLLFRRWHGLRELVSRRGILIACAVSMAYLTLPLVHESASLGLLNRTATALVPVPALKTLCFAGLSWLACVRFARVDLAGWLVVLSALLSLKYQVAWEKYLLPLACALWYLRAQWPAQIDDESETGEILIPRPRRWDPRTQSA